MKKIKSPWYGVTWIGIWTAGLIWFLYSGMFNRTESIGLIVVWAVLVGTTAYLLLKHFRTHGWRPVARVAAAAATPAAPALNALCPCGSGKKYKRCCGK
jgi:TRAP-type C4-dicarboxylate transport system permease large subunit